MKKIILYILLVTLFSTYACNRHESLNRKEFVRVENGVFMIGDSIYRFIGTNFWYGAILASEGRGGDRPRLERELDLLQDIGINNLRIMIGGDGDENIPSHIMPVLQQAPGVYNDTILDGLDYLMSQLEKRGMKAVLYLNNAWEWSGGYGTYLEWAGAEKAPNPGIDGYDKYMNFVAGFVSNDSAKQLAADHVRNIVSRTNRYTRKPYSASPAIMSWQIANEPRAFASDSTTKESFAQWISSQAALIKSLDPNHMVSTGSEGKHGCENDIDLWARIHSDKNIDYGLIHLWPYNWGWVNEQNLEQNVDYACDKAREYIMSHELLMNETGKPLVLEEFGYPRDNFSFDPGSPTNGRDKFYAYIFSLILEDGLIDGCNFWGWGGDVKPSHICWQTWDDYTADPAQEQQGLNSVFATDSSTLHIIKNATTKVSEIN
ncbi:MAG: beta-mannosidase [Muribaculum sp.]|nr:beta-mannosidase [Muribaculum sp.]